MDNRVIADTIRNQIIQGVGMPVVWSWGADKWTVIEDGVAFKVHGFIHKGYVSVKLDPSDTYVVRLQDDRGNVVKQLENIYCDELGEVIDREVERGTISDAEYGEKISKEYDL